MAKSLKSKSKRAFRAIKRTDPNSVFKQADDLRLQRLSAKLKASALKPRERTDKEEWERKQDGYETEEEGEGEQAAPKDAKTEDKVVDEMAVDGEQAETSEPAPKQKISTSGPRMTRREVFRTEKNFMVRPTPKTVFPARGEKKRTGLGRSRSKR
ncbi:BZ3500_MvSof-1268-A1-R1_Chr2-1g04360 [Microbotryum saponariae]|uniref:BZ3500_MvSof-1268-A1-R1_Chr2-1g04360 protein n=1 Tax=Microbotryum saponariae TaxID=289078 RepID=A0A2X0KYU4_9BASI|nr:BZ3500_MvSof-1268-A1-R1_Chr2-1g04360 [Microbotryum saponariae]SCZ91541.1 BZ3501_MvSof-1269-A2-R1_Chr2-1g04016 [Microbotryum saponariae]